MKNPLDGYLDRSQQHAIAAVGALVAVGVAVHRTQGKGAASAGSRQRVEAPAGREVEAPRRAKQKVRPAAKVKAPAKGSAKVSAKPRSTAEATAKAKTSSPPSEWSRFLSVRVPQLVKQGYTAPQAMKKAAAEFRAR